MKVEKLAKNGQMVQNCYPLSPGGEYHGFDIGKDMIDWGTAHLSSIFPHLFFTHANLVNGHYGNDASSLQASVYQFPYLTSFFDVVFMPSVFTHLLTDDMEHYLREIHRILRPGGLAYINYFIFDEHVRKQTGEEEARQTGMLDSVLRENDPGKMWCASPPQIEPSFTCERAVAFEEEYLKRVLQAAGFQLRASPQPSHINSSIKSG